ncbi:substrate-binding domain-containing protein [Caballeronia sp. AZ7_KS35]|uniref:substrate-binding domain-containing protein n=1 Tax=Caballeronia sp. AZ7_KS35 TaxID=2921762 RepID=UPI0020281E54|nr:substrate-binding domain-containing protein [Caballeronia sp. AZ7_KS35]
MRQPRLSGSVQETELFADPYVVAVREGHRLSQQNSIAPHDLAEHDRVVPQRNVPRRAVIDRIFARLPAKPPLVVETSSLAMMIAMLAESDCITLLTRAQIQEEYPSTDIVALELKTPEVHREVGYTVRSDRLGTTVQQAFVEYLLQECVRRSKLIQASNKNPA